MNILLGGRATLLMMCLASILLSWPHVAWVYGTYAVEVGLSMVLAVHVAGSMTRHICLGLYPLFLKTVVRNSSSLVTKSFGSMLSGKRGLVVC